MRLAITICLCAVLISIAVFFSSASLTVLQIGRAASQVEDVAKEIRKGSANTFQRFNAATDEWRASSRKTVAYLDWTLINTRHTIKELNGAVQDIRTFTRNTDERLNGTTGVLPAATSAIRKTEALTAEAISAIAETRRSIETASADLHSTASALSDTLAATQRTADEATKAIEQMRLVTEGPIADSAKNVARGTENLAVWSERFRKSRAWIWDALVAGLKFLKP